MVQNGKFAAWAREELMQLNKVDLPTFGKPTIPHFKAMFHFLIITCKDSKNAKI
jgi:hypothetical protein